MSKPLFFSTLLLICPLLSQEPPAESQTADPVIIKTLNQILLFSSAQDIALYAAPELPIPVETVGIQLPGKPAVLAKRLADQFIGKPMTKQSLYEIRKAIILYYEESGRPLVTIDLPRQEVTAGVLKLVVIEGKLGEVVCIGNQWYSCSRLKSYIRAKPGEPIDAHALLNDIAFMNRNPFRHTDAFFSAGTEEGTSNIELVTQDRRPFRLYGGMDNTGNIATTRGRWFAGFNWGNAFSADQLLTYQYTAAFDLNLFQAHTVNYIAPLPWRDQVMIYGGYSRAEPDISGFDSSGHSGQASFRYIIPCGAMYAGWLKEVQLGFDYKNTNNNFEFTDTDIPIVTKNINLSQLFLGFNFGMGGERHEFATSVQGYFSPGQLLPDESDANYQDLRFKATADYVYARAMMEYTYTAPDVLSIFMQGRGQYSNRNLIPSETFGLGGYDTVRGYGEREVNADEAFCFNFEIRSAKLGFLDYFWNLKTKDELTLLAFYDFGWGGYKDPLPGERRNQWLDGAGPGLRYAIPPYFSLRLDLGFRIRKTQFSQDPFIKLHVGVMASY